MKNERTDVKVIGVGLLVLYAVSIFFYAQMFRHSGGNETRALVLAVLFAVCFAAALVVINFKEWGRSLLVGANGVLGLYLLWPYLVSVEDFISASNILITIIVVLFFGRSSISALFQPGSVSVNKDHGHDPAAAPTPGAGATYSRSILVVDDDEAVLKTVRPILMKQGYGVLTATSGEDGFRIAKNQTPALIILDVILPGIKGRDLCRKLKEEPATKDIPVIFLTAKYSQDDIRAELEAGAQAHLTKPVNPKSLTAVVRDILEARKEKNNV